MGNRGAVYLECNTGVEDWKEEMEGKLWLVEKGRLSLAIREG